MGIYVKGISKPGRCEYCGFCRLYKENGRVWCNAKNRILKQVHPTATDLHIDVPEWCPLVEVAEPHGKLIDAEKIDYKGYKMHKNGKVLFSDDFFKGIQWISDCIDETPAVIEAEWGD